MLALEQVHANALIVVLLGGALAIVSLRVAVYFCRRTLVEIDRKVIASLPNEQREQPMSSSSGARSSRT